MKKSLTGIRTSGTVHIGNYLGAIAPALELQKEYHCLYFLADLHALTTVRDPQALKKDSLDQAALWLALGLDINMHVLWKQSDIPEVTELAWYLSCVTGFGFVEKAHSFKDAQANSRDINVGVYYYPLLMAADILLYDSDVVPVGKDQKQHVEMARDMAGAFNAVFGENILKLPEVRIREDVMTVPGLDGRKMSKSYNNTIELMLPEKDLRKKLMGLQTDSTPLEAPKSMKGTALGDLYKNFTTPEQFADLEKRLQAGGLGWGHAKDELFQAINKVIAPARDRFNDIRKDEAQLLKTLATGAAKARQIAEPVISRVRQATGVRL